MSYRKHSISKGARRAHHRREAARRRKLREKGGQIEPFGYADVRGRSVKQLRIMSVTKGSRDGAPRLLCDSDGTATAAANGDLPVPKDCQARPSPNTPKPRTDPTMTEREVWLVWGTKGEYSDRSEWPVAAYEDEASAQAAAVELKRLSRDLYAIYRQREDELETAGDWNGKTLLTSTDEGRAFVALHGASEAPGSYDFDDMEFTCCAVPLRANKDTQATKGRE